VVVKLLPVNITSNTPGRTEAR